MNFFRRGQQPIVVVSGLPRSGTSLMMQMLHAGGVPILSDEHRPADDSNPRGYFEFAPVKRMHTGDLAWLADAGGKAVKIVSALITMLPPQYPYRVIFMQRPLDEVLRSQQTMRGRLGTTAENTDMAKLEADTVHHVQTVEAWLAAQARIDVLWMGYADILANPAAEAQHVATFIGGNLDVTAMARAVDPSLYRERGE